jgi:general secretion pathway protein J
MKFNVSNKGFTLIEVLVSLTLLGIIFLLLFSSLYTSNKSWIAGEKKIERNDEIRLVSHYLRKQLSQTLPMTWINGKDQTLLFSGNENTLIITSTLPSHRGGGGLNLISLKTEQVDDNSNLIIEYQQIQTDEPDFINTEESEKNKTVLISNIDHIEFNYYGSDDTNTSPDWHSEWKNKKNLPQLIRLTIQSSLPNAIWPQIDVALPVQSIKGMQQFTLTSKNEAPLI